MRIDHYSTYTFGGAGNGARRLHEGLLKQGIESRFFYRDSNPEHEADPSFTPFANLAELPRRPNKPWQWLKYRIRKSRSKRDRQQYIENRPAGFEVFSGIEQISETPWSPSTVSPGDGSATSQPDIIHLHWVAFWLDFASFFQSLPKDIPLVWTLHDMNPFTGGCHYSSGCRRFESGCGHCPQIDNSGPRDLSGRIYEQKKRLFENENLTIVTPSEWLSREAQRSGMFPEQTRYTSINLGLDTNAFRPMAKQQARHELGLPSDSLLIAFGAEDLQNRRKGMPHLWQALDRLATKQPVDALFFGHGEPEKKPAGIRSMHPLGFISDSHQQRLVYSAADLFVMPSLQDNQPQMGLESMACGTPVVAFDTGGIPEYVIPGVTGELAPVGNADRLATAIASLLDNPEHRSRLAKQSRQHIESEFPLHRQAQNYLELYRERCNELNHDSSARSISTPRAA